MRTYETYTLEETQEGIAVLEEAVVKAYALRDRIEENVKTAKAALDKLYKREAELLEKGAVTK